MARITRETTCSSVEDVAERARVARNCHPGTALAAALSNLSLHHTRHPIPPSSHGRAPWSPAHWHADAIPAYHPPARYRATGHGIVDEGSSDAGRTEHAVGRALPGMTARSADGLFGDPRL